MLRQEMPRVVRRFVRTASSSGEARCTCSDDRLLLFQGHQMRRKVPDA
jgi:hypothetical protein